MEDMNHLCSSYNLNIFLAVADLLITCTSLTCLDVR